MYSFIRFLFTCFLLLQVSAIFSQAPGGVIKGHVFDEKSNKGLSFASVQVWKSNDSTLFTGALTDDKGWFNITSVKPGNYFLRISYVGYKTLDKKNIVVSPSLEFDAGNILLSLNATLSKEIIISGEKGSVTLSADKKIYNIGSQISPGASANDVLLTLPSISANDEGKLQLRGNESITILVDGRPTSVGGQGSNILDQLNASQIEKIEVITNPSSQFDAEGTGGIVNIVLKKNIKTGLNGNTGFTIGSNNKTSAQINLNARGKKLNVFGGGNFRYNETFGSGLINRYYSVDTVYSLLQKINNTNKPLSATYRTGIDWYVNPRNTLGFTIAGGVTDGTSKEKIEYSFLNSMEEKLSAFSLNSNVENNTYNNDISVYYKKTFSKNNAEFNASASFNNNYDKKKTQTIPSFELGIDSSVNAFLNTIILRNEIFIAQLDYQQSIFKDWKLESGLKQTLRGINNDFENVKLLSDLTTIDSTYFLRKLIYDDNISGVYTSLSHSFNKTSVKAGIRVERAERKIELNQEFNNERYDFFPSFFATRQLKNKKEISFSYSKRINRPSIQTLNPFPDFNDPFNQLIGNPYIKPEFIHAAELGYQQYFKNMVFNATLYYRLTVNQIQRIRTTIGNISYIQFTNLNSGNNAGLELILKADWFKWWTQTFSGNIYSVYLDGSNVNENYRRNNFTWNAKWVSTLKIKKTFSLQINGNYDARNVVPQGVILPRYSLDVSMKKDLWKQKANISLGLTDIFNTRVFRINTLFETITQNVERRRESRILTLGFNYRFGTQVQTKRNNTQPGNEFGGGSEF